MKTFRNFSEETAEILQRGGIGVIPTDTIYGLVGSAFKKKTVERIYDLKDRNEKKPFIVLISGYADLERFGVRLSKDLREQLQKFWSRKKDIQDLSWDTVRKKKDIRPTSVILTVPSKKLAYLHRGTGTIAFRMPSAPLLRRFLRKTGPLVAPSANPEGQPPATTIQEAQDYFEDEVDFYVDSGKKRGKPSRLIDISSGRLEILRK